MRAHSSRTGPTDRPGKSPATILIVDDYEDNRRMMRKLLEMSGYDVLEADNGVDAVTVALEERPSLVIMDLGLPALSGVEATKLIRRGATADALPIIALSAYDVASIREDALASGCDYYLTKPVDFDALEETIRDLLSRYPDQDQP